MSFLELMAHVCVHFFCLCVYVLCVRVTQPLPGISDGKTVRLQWTTSKDVNPNNHPYTLSLSHVHALYLSPQLKHMRTHTHTHAHNGNKHICTHAHKQSNTRGEKERPYREIQGIQMHACAWTMGGFYASTLFCANHPLVHSSEFKSSRVHRKNKICSPFPQVVNYAYMPNIHIQIYIFFVFQKFI